MATVYVTEYANIGRELKKNISQSPAEPHLAEQSVAITAGSVQSAAFNTKTRLVRVHTDAVCSIAFGANPTAVATARRLAANSTEYFSISDDLQNAGAVKIAVITNV